MITRDGAGGRWAGCRRWSSPVSSFASAARGAADVRLARDGGQAREVDAVGTGHEAQDRLQGRRPPRGRRRPATSRSGPAPRRRPRRRPRRCAWTRRRCGRRARRPCARRRRSTRWVGGAIGVSGTAEGYTTARTPRRRAGYDRPMPDLDAPIATLSRTPSATPSWWPTATSLRAAALDAAWPGWDAGIADVVAADGGLARARALGLSPDRAGGGHGLARPARSPARRDGRRDRRCCARRPTRTSRTPSSRSWRRSGRARPVSPSWARSAGRGWTTRWPTCGCWRTRALAGVTVVLLDAAARASLVTAPAADGSPVRRPLPGPLGATVSLLPLGGDVTGVTTAGLRYPLRRRAAAGPDRPAACPTCGPAQDAAVTVRAGRLLVVETALGREGYPRCHEHAAGRRPGPRGRAPRRARHHPSTWPTAGAPGPSSTSTPRTTRPAARPRPAASATSTASSTASARRSGASARTAPAATAAFRAQVRPAVHAPVGRGPRASPSTTAPGARRPNYGASTWDHPVRVPRATRTADRQGMAQRQGGRPRREVLEALRSRPIRRGSPDPGMKEASPVGGDERSLDSKSAHGAGTFVPP